MPKYLIKSNTPKNSFGDPLYGAYHRFNLFSNLTNYDFLETLTCLQDVHKISDQNSFIWAVFKTQTFYYSRKDAVLAYLTFGQRIGPKFI